MKSSDAKASKCHLKFSSKMIIFIKLVKLHLEAFASELFKYQKKKEARNQGPSSPSVFIYPPIQLPALPFLILLFLSSFVSSHLL